MKPILWTSLPILAAACMSNPVSAADARFQVSAGEQYTVLVDTHSGRSWVLQPAQFAKGSPSDKRYEWLPIGFDPAKAHAAPSGSTR